MKSSPIFSGLALAFSIAYGYSLLQFIEADNFLWLLWILTLVFTILSAVCGVIEAD